MYAKMEDEHGVGNTGYFNIQDMLTRPAKFKKT